MKTKISLRAAAVLLIAVFVLPHVAGCARAPETAAEVDAVFLIVVDTLRPDRLSCYGYQGHETPAIDRIAGLGVRFEHAHSPASWTVPGMGSMLSALYPTQLGMVERPPKEDRQFEWRERRKQVRYTLPGTCRPLAAVLDDAGFYPVAFVNQPFVNAHDGFLQGFAEWCYTTGENSIEWHDVTTSLPTIEFPAGTDLGRADVLLVTEFRKWIAANSDRKPFVWLHLLLPHAPYTPSLRYVPDQLRKPGADVKNWQLYEAEIRQTDAAIAAVMNAIETQVGLDRSLVIFVSDHGEGFGEHRMWEHGHTLHREVLEVPLILAGPSLPAGHTVTDHVSTVDLLPTVLAYIGADSLTPPGIEGRSLLPVIAGTGGKRDLYADGMLYGSTERCLISGGYKLMFDAQADPAWRLYDLDGDPDETNDIAVRDAARLERLRKILLDMHTRFVNDYEKTIDPAAAETNPETQRVLRAMRALGYVGD
jgi:arylsulfatase A-like enzyme